MAKLLYRLALISTKDELLKLIPKVEKAVEELTVLAQIGEAYSQFVATGEDTPEAQPYADVLNRLDPKNKYMDSMSIREAFDDVVYKTQGLIKPEMDELVERAEQRKNHIEAFGWFSRGSILELWDVLVASGFNLRVALRTLGNFPSLISELKTRWKRAAMSGSKYLGVGISELRRMLQDESDKETLYEIRDRFMKASGEFVKPTNQNTGIQSVTSYGLINPEEDFCDTFMYYCMGWKIPPEVEERFLPTIGK